MAKQFGRDILLVGATYVLRDITASERHRPVEHIPCRLRTVEVSSDGAVRVGVSFIGHSGLPSDTVDADGFSSEVSCWCFPHQLRSV